MLRPFELRRATDLAEVGALIREHGDDAALYAGGTELLLLMKEGLVRPRVLIDLKRVPGLADITAQDGAVRIGATARHVSVERSTAVRERYPLVAGAARHVANVRVRAAGTVGGNLAFADPHSDLATLFLVFDAAVELWSLDGARELALEDFVRGPYETARRDDEVLTAVRLHSWPGGAGGAYLKFGVHERPTLGVAVVLVPDGERRLVAEARVAIGCVGPRPERLAALERRLRGLPLAEVGADRIDLDGTGIDRIDAIDDLHGAADYKLEMARVFIRRALRVAAARAAGAPIDASHPYTVVV
jgi:aerobic carbon-monoxide dehydrogenase medium subunit